MREEKEKYQNIGIDKNNLNKWQKRFIREFVNDHGNAWRPLRGLWVEDVLDFIQKEIEAERIRMLGKFRKRLSETRAGEFADWEWERIENDILPPKERKDLKNK